MPREAKRPMIEDADCLLPQWDRKPYSVEDGIACYQDGGTECADCQTALEGIAQGVFRCPRCRKVFIVTRDKILQRGPIIYA